MRREISIVLAAIAFLSLTPLSLPNANGKTGTSKTDAFIPPDVTTRRNLKSSFNHSSQSLRSQSSLSPGIFETSEYLIGSIAVGIILPESNGAVDPSTEDWTSFEELAVISGIQAGLNWWTQQNPQANVSFTYDIHYRVETRYEPISHPAIPDQTLWIGDVMNCLGYAGSDIWSQVRDYINKLRETKRTNWSFAIFIVSSKNDIDGEFTDGLFAYAYIGGPFFIMTYDNDGWGIENINKVAAHETGHIFYATDEYDNVKEYSGYLNVADVDGSRALMDRNTMFLSSGTWGQVGWRDIDRDGIQDIVDTYSHTDLQVYSPDPTTDSNLVYNGSVTEVPYPNHNPYGTCKNVTINTIVNVQFRVDNGTWITAEPNDGSFSAPEEAFNFTTVYLLPGNHSIEARATNSVGNIETSYPNDQVTRLPLSVDINGDKIIDIYDLILFGKAFGSKPEDPNWNPIVDLVPDAIIDILDGILISTEFGETRSET